MTKVTNFQVVSDNIAPVSDLNFEKCSQYAYKASLINASVFFLIFVAVILVTYSFFKEHAIIFLAVFSVGCLVTIGNFIYLWYYYKNLSYALREKDITLKEGVLFKSDTTMPFIRVQHSEVNQSLIQRYFRIASLQLYTAGGSGVDMTINGLDEVKAENIKNFILGNNTQNTELHGEEE
jgi:membrane protein YdbS with pleckstrin-like domain